MAKQQFYDILKQETARIDSVGSSKRFENTIEGFTQEVSPKAIIAGKKYLVFNSNDYLGLRFNSELIEAEHAAAEKFGAGPGAVRFISGTLQVYKDLERAIADFQGKEEAMVFSSAFATNIAVMSCLLKGQSKDSLLSNEVIVISDELNHRSIIDGIRAASIGKEQKAIYKHLDFNNLKQVLEENKTKFKRAVVVSDGIFSMIGEAVDLKSLRAVCDEFDAQYEQGVLLVIDDSHGVGAYGATGRGCEEASNTKADVIVGTFGKAFGSDGGYVVGSKVFIDYLRESAATYIYSNSISPSVAGAALKAVQLVNSDKGKELLAKVRENATYLKQKMKEQNLQFVADSQHPIQPLLVGDTMKAKQLKDELYKQGIIVTNITYPVVPKGKDEIRIQMNASHTQEDIDTLVQTTAQAAKKLGILS
jgi:glycine C-acetyltransferase